MSPIFLKRIIFVFCITFSVSGCNPFSAIQFEDDLAKIEGSWSVLWSGKDKLEGVPLRPTIIFDVQRKTISGFNGCSAYVGDFSIIDGFLITRVIEGNGVCSNPKLDKVREQMRGVFGNRTTIIDISIAKGHVLSLRNEFAELRLAPTRDVATIPL